MIVLELIFKNFWTFIGSFLLLGILAKTLVQLLRGYPPKNYSDDEIVAIYKFGKMDAKNGYHLNDDQILSEVEALLNGKKKRHV